MSIRFRSLLDLYTQALSLSERDFLDDCGCPVLLPEAVRGGWLQRTSSGGTFVLRSDLGEAGAVLPLEGTRNVESPRALLVRADRAADAGRKIFLGRTAGTAVTVNDRSVSKVHLEFVYQVGGRWQIVDKNSRNGTFINDERLKPGVKTDLKSWDTLQVGRIRLIFMAPRDLREALRSAPA
jgi:pSer/pThr/pTyr-binding forkhead associated (FHA) protein